MRILFLVPYPTEGASNRVRVEQFVPYLESRGVTCTIRPFVNSRFYKILYLPHRYTEKAFWFVLCAVNRLLDVIRAIGYNAVFIHRESFPFGGAVIESIFTMMKKPIIFDFDDAIFIPNTSEHNIYIERFKNPDKVAKIIRMASVVIAGNGYLREYASGYNKNTRVIPSSIDIEKYKPVAGIRKNKEVVIGWIGSDTTKRFLYDLEKVFIALSNAHSDVILKIVGPSFSMERFRNINNKKWSLEDEVTDIQSFDIGIMPMPDNEWTRGKCGFKAILYMACGIPAVVSPVGVNVDIVEDGVNGFYARSQKEWLDKLSALIADRALRELMGKKGRERIALKYSLDSNAPLFYEALKQVSTHNK